VTPSVPELKLDLQEESVAFAVRVAPRASRARAMGVHDGALKLALTKPPVDGAANEALIKLLSKALGVAKTRVRIAHGEHARLKHIVIETDAPKEVASRLRSLARR
jgi:uncharacterized protein (TIGR00251 family)